MKNIIQSLEFQSKKSDNNCWVIKFDGVIISGAKHRAFSTKGRAFSSFSHLIRWEVGHYNHQNPKNTMTTADVRRELMRTGRLTFENLGTSW